MPQLKQQKDALVKELQNVNNTADGILNELSTGNSPSAVFVKEKLENLGKIRKEIENGIQKINQAIEEITRDSLDTDFIAGVLGNFTDVFKYLKPYQQKELIRLVLYRADISETEMKMTLYGNLPDIGSFDLSETQNNSRSVITNWLPRPDSNQRHGG